MLFTRKMKVSQALRPIEETDIKTMPRLAQKLKFLQMTQEDVASIRKLEGIIERYAADITKRHYDMLGMFGGLTDIIDEHSTIERLTKTFIQYLNSIPQIDFDSNYVANRVRIGEIHSHIRLTPEWYTGSYVRLYEYLIPAIIEEFGSRPNELAGVLMSLIRIITLDSQIVLESYQEANDYKVIASTSNVMEMILGLDKVKSLMNTVDSAIHEATSVSAAAEQLSASVEEVAGNAVGVAENTEETIRQVNMGQNVIESSLKGFLGMTDDFIATKNKINTLLNEIGNVTQVVSFIKDVADQTNLLALNASIEAARAGEQGRGFAVVAGEVRKLAEQTKESVDKITATIQQVEAEALQVGDTAEKMAAQLGERVNQANKAISTLGSIVEQIEMIGSATSNIAAIAQEQSAATQDITSRISEVLHHTDHIRSNAGFTGKLIYDTSLEINSLREKAVRSIPVLGDKQTIRVVKTEHLLWKWWIYNSILGFHSIDGSSTFNAHECRLGIWMEGVNKKNSPIASLASFKALAEPHDKLHAVVYQASESIKQGKIDEAEASLGEIENLSQAICELLDQLYTEVDNRLRSAGKA